MDPVIALAPRHADAHIALGAFHAEVIAKVGKLLGRTQGADCVTLNPAVDRSPPPRRLHIY